MKKNTIFALLLITLVSSRLLIKDTLFTKKNDVSLDNDDIIIETNKINNEIDDDNSIIENNTDSQNSENQDNKNIIKEEIKISNDVEIKKEESNNVNVSTKEVINVEPKETTDKKNDISTNNNIESKEEIINVTKKEETIEPIIKTLKEQNQDLINEIKNTYGYNVTYGDEDFWYNGLPSTKLTDENKANIALNKLKVSSNLFPTDFFKIFQGYNGFRVLLFEHINGAAGVTSYEFGDDNYIAIDINNGYLERVFYHETFHIMEKYISYKTYNQTFPFDNWNNLNPLDFSYGEDGIKYTSYDLNGFSRYTDPTEIAFVSEYAKSSPVEDRAELFADLMFRGIKKEYMKNGFAINEKAKTMSLVLRDYFPNSTHAYWERNIEW